MSHRKGVAFLTYIASYVGFLSGFDYYISSGG